MLHLTVFNRRLTIVLLFALVSVILPDITHAQNPLRNEAYRIEARPGGAVYIQAESAKPLRFAPVFTVLRADRDPKLELRPANLPNVRYNVPTWKVDEDQHRTRAVETRERSSQEVGDGFDPRILEGDEDDRTAHYFLAADTVIVTAIKADRVEDQIIWQFPDQTGFTLRARLTLGAGTEEPALHITFTPREKGWYSIGYTGAPTYDPDTVDEIWQPLIWQEKRFPDQAYLTTAFRGPVPTTFVTAEGSTTGVIAAPSEFPFQPLPTFENSRFGMTVRSASGKAQSSLFAPVLGGIESRMAPRQPYDFEMRLLVRPGDASSAFQHVARQIYGFHDYRQNADGYTLNETIENMVDYALSTYAHFNEELKGASYATDVPGAVKNVSSLYPLSVAMITDSGRIYRERAYPLIEYMLSREKFLFTVDPEIKGQGASWRMNGPAAPLTELTALYEISGRRTPVFLQMADSLLDVDRVLNLDTKVQGDRWPNLLAMYRATGDTGYLERAMNGADAYIKERIEEPSTNYEDDFVGGDPFFWTQFVPAFIPLYDLYEETGKKRYLDAALQGAREYAMFAWMGPRIPEEHVLVNEGGQAPQYWYLESKGHKPMKAPEAFIEAWKLSAIGLTSESSSTSNGHRGIFMANPAPWLSRLARDSNDTFLHDVARSAVVGRYANFPGYHINTARTNVFMQPDYPLRPHKELSYNSFHYNHIWPHIAMLFDYLVSEAYYRSAGRISFSGHYGEGYAYLQSKVYGDGAGRFYEAEDARLWMPRGLVEVTNDQVNYLAARGEDALYLALMNASDEVVKTTVRLDSVLIGMHDRRYTVSVWKGGESAEDTMMQNGALTVTIPPKGLTALAIEGIHPQPQFQQRIGGGSALSENSFTRLGVGGTRGMLLSMGEGLTTAYVFLQATHKDIRKARLHYREGGSWTTLTDTSYPFEFTRKLNSADEGFTFHVEVYALDGTTRQTDTVTLER